VNWLSGMEQSDMSPPFSSAVALIENIGTSSQAPLCCLDTLFSWIYKKVADLEDEPSTTDHLKHGNQALLMTDVILHEPRPERSVHAFSA
jgi:hypothetical protein